MIFTIEHLAQALDIDVDHIERKVGKEVIVVTPEGLKYLHQEWIDKRIKEVQIKGGMRNAIQAGAQSFFHYLHYRLFR